MFETLQRLWSSGRLDETKLQSAVDKGFITQEQANQIKQN